MNIILPAAIVLLATLALGLSFSTFLLFRNGWTFRARMRVLEEQPYPREFNRLPSYDYMVWHFWIWDIEKFKR